MRKRFALVWALVVLCLALMLPATTSAATLGKIANTGTTCRNNGNKVVASFKLTKYSGYHATRLQMSVYGQGYYSSGWRNDYFIGTYYVNINTNGGYFFKDSFYYKDNKFGSSRIKVVAKIINNGHVVATGNAHSAHCG